MIHLPFQITLVSPVTPLFDSLIRSRMRKRPVISPSFFHIWMTHQKFSYPFRFKFDLDVLSLSTHQIRDNDRLIFDLSSHRSQRGIINYRIVFTYIFDNIHSLLNTNKPFSLSNAWFHYYDLKRRFPSPFFVNICNILTFLAR